ncbi:MAG: hypothetical protein J5600_01855, partial [Desulfovibrio sp.]|nr:hypothetical protein [Desulfovibrio sp.]
PSIFYGIDIRQEGGEILADIDGDGFQTLMRIRTSVSGDEDSIQLRFKEAREDNVLASFDKGELLLTLERQEGRLLTRWNGIMVGRAPEVCFARTGQAKPGAAAAESGATADSASDPLASEPGLRDAVSVWDEAVDRAVKAFDGLAPDEADQLYVSDGSPLKTLNVTDAYQMVDKASESLFARWAQHFDDARLSPADRACFAELARHGLVKAMAEGTPYFRIDQGALEEPVYARLSPAMAGYARLQKRQPASFVEDAGRRFSIGQLLGWALEWERFIQKGASGQARRAAVERYEYLMELCLFSVLDNDPAFSRGKMTEDVRRGLEEGSLRLKGTITGRLAGDYVGDVRKNGWKYSKTIEQRHRQLLRQAFQTAR